MDTGIKTTSSTFHSENRAACDCGEFSPEMFRERLEQILASLQAEIEIKDREVAQCIAAMEETLRQKEDIIERLLAVNSQLTAENRKIKKIQLSQDRYLKGRLFVITTKFESEKKQQQNIINYLQKKNSQLIKQINDLQSLQDRKISKVLKDCLSPPHPTPLTLSRINVKNSAAGSSTIFNHTTTGLKKVTSAKFLQLPTDKFFQPPTDRFQQLPTDNRLSREISNNFIESTADKKLLTSYQFQPKTAAKQIHRRKITQQCWSTNSIY